MLTYRIVIHGTSIGNQRVAISNRIPGKSPFAESGSGAGIRVSPRGKLGLFLEARFEFLHTTTNRQQPCRGRAWPSV